MDLRNVNIIYVSNFKFIQLLVFKISVLVNTLITPINPFLDYTS